MNVNESIPNTSPRNDVVRVQETRCGSVISSLRAVTSGGKLEMRSLSPGGGGIFSREASPERINPLPPPSLPDCPSFLPLTPTPFSTSAACAEFPSQREHIDCTEEDVRNIRIGQNVEYVEALSKYTRSISDALSGYEKFDGALLSREIKEKIFSLKCKVERSRIAAEQFFKGLNTRLDSLLGQVNLMTKAALLSSEQNSLYSHSKNVSKVLDETARVLLSVPEADKTLIIELHEIRNQACTARDKARLRPMLERLSLIENVEVAQRNLDQQVDRCVKVRHLLRLLLNPHFSLSEQYFKAVQAFSTPDELSLIENVLKECRFNAELRETINALRTTAQMEEVNRDFNTLQNMLEKSVTRCNRRNTEECALENIHRINQYFYEINSAQKAYQDTQARAYSAAQDAQYRGLKDSEALENQWHKEVLLAEIVIEDEWRNQKVAIIVEESGEKNIRAVGMNEGGAVNHHVTCDEKIVDLSRYAVHLSRKDVINAVKHSEYALAAEITKRRGFLNMRIETLSQAIPYKNAPKVDGHVLRKVTVSQEKNRKIIGVVQHDFEKFPQFASSSNLQALLIEQVSRQLNQPPTRHTELSQHSFSVAPTLGAASHHQADRLKNKITSTQVNDAVKSANAVMLRPTLESSLKLDVAQISQEFKNNEVYMARRKENTGRESLPQATPLTPAVASTSRPPLTSAQSTLSRPAIAACQAQVLPSNKTGELTAIHLKNIKALGAGDFYRMLSCAISVPIFYVDKNNKITRVHLQGRLSYLINSDPKSISDGLVLYFESRDEKIEARKTAMKTLTMLNTDKSNVAALKFIPRDLYAVQNEREMYQVIMSTMEDFSAEASKFLNLLYLKNKTTRKDDLLYCSNIFQKLSTKLCGKTVIRSEFFRLLAEKIKESPARTTSLISPVLQRIGNPPVAWFKVIATKLLHAIKDSEDSIDDLACFLATIFILYKDSEDNALKSFIVQVTDHFQKINISAYPLFMIVAKNMYKEIDSQGNAQLDLHTILIIACNRVTTALNNSNRSMKYHVDVLEPLLPMFTYPGQRFKTQAYPRIRDYLLDRSICPIIQFPQNISIKDKVLLFAMMGAFQYPRNWAVDVVSKFETIIDEHGRDGNAALATLYLIIFANSRISSENGRAIFKRFFQKHVQRDSGTQALALLMVSGVMAKSLIPSIYRANDKEALDLILEYWNIYNDVKLTSIGENKCLIIGNGLGRIDDKVKYLTGPESKDKSPVFLSMQKANNWIGKCRYIEEYIFTHKECDAIFSRMLIDYAANKNKVNFIADIIKANESFDVNINKSKVSELNVRLQHLLVEGRENSKTDKKSAENNKSLFEAILSLQINLFNSGGLKNAEKLLENVVSNFASIDKFIEMKAPFTLLNDRLIKGDINDHLYLSIISKVIQTSCAKKNNDGVEFIRNQLMHEVYQMMARRNNLDELLKVFGNIVINIPPKLAGYGVFIEHIKREIQSSSLSNPAEGPNRKELIRFILAQDITWLVFKGAFQESIPNSVNIDWLFNPENFFEAKPARQHSMLKFDQDIGDKPSPEFIKRCILAVGEGLALKSNAINHTLVRSFGSILNFLTQGKSLELIELMDFILKQCETLRDNGVLSSLAPMKDNALQGMLNVIKTQNTVEAEKLSKRLDDIFGKSQSSVYYEPQFKDENLSNSTTSTSDFEGKNKKRSQRNSITEESMSATESVLASNVERKPIKDKEKLSLYIETDWQSLKKDYDKDWGLEEGMQMFLSNSRASELNLHPYTRENKESRFYTIVLKPKNTRSTKGKHRGKSNARAGLLKGSHNRYIFVGAGNHKEMEALSTKYSKKTKEQIDQRIESAQEKSYRLLLNEFEEIETGVEDL
ncbi:hypothetical protein BS639_22505 [Rouxiella silvae]|uniref:Ras-GAP domain-containing protein n=1 Tax=Rouxiella silvae TaxID=1646373 RepID=A0ABX3TUS1_9GAMM|nr:hypothetical protein [Rouxiella silvae]ORJ18963.1 hypothetical protein BS639_22505 [Rouxiella silvae]